MAEQLKIDINTTAAQASIDRLSESFKAFSSTTVTNIDKAATALERLSKIEKIKAVPKGFTNSIRTLAESLQGMDTSKLQAVSAAFEKLGQTAPELDKAAKAAKSVSTALDKIRAPKGLSDIKTKVKSIPRDMNVMAESAKKSRAAFDKLSSSSNKLKGSFDPLKTVMRGAATASAKIGASFGKLQAKLGPLNTAFAKVKNNLKGFAALGAIAIGFHTLKAAISGILGPIVSTSQAFIDLNLVVDQIDGKGAGAKTLNVLRGVASRTGTSLKVLTQTYTGFRVASESAGVSAEATTKIVEGFSKGLRATGAGAERTKKAFLALEQMFSKGTVSSEELRRQLGDALPGAFTKAAKSIGVTTKELNNLLKQGKVMAKELVPAMAAVLDQDFGSVVAKQLKTAIGQMTLFDNAITELQNSAGEGGLGGVMQGVAKGLEVINQALSSMSLDVFVRALGDVMGVMIAFTTGAIGGFIIGLTAVTEALLQAGKFVASLIPNFDSLTAAMNRIMEAAFAAVPGLKEVVVYLQENATVMKAVALAGQALGIALGLVTARAAGLMVVAGLAAGWKALGLAFASTTITTYSLSGAITALNLAITANPWGVAMAAVGIAGAVFASFSGQVFATAESLAEVDAASRDTAQAATELGRSLEIFQNRLAKTPTLARETADEMFTYETAMKAAKTQVKELEISIRANTSALAQSASSFASYQSVEKDFIAGIKSEVRALEDQKSSLQENAKYITDMGGSTQMAQAGMRNLDREMKSLKDTIKDSNEDLADRQRRESEWARSMKSVSDAAKDQRESLKLWGVALEGTSLALAEKLKKLGMTRTESARYAKTVELLNMSDEKRIALIKKEADRYDKLAVVMSGIVKQQEKLLEKKIADLRAGDATEEQIQKLTSRHRAFINEARGATNALVESSVSANIAARSYSNMGDLTRIAGEETDKANKKFSTTADSFDMAGKAMEKMLPDLSKLGGATEKAATETGKHSDALDKTAPAIDKVKTASEGTATAVSKVSTAMSTASTTFTNVQTSLTGIATSLTNFVTGATTVKDTLPPMNEGLTNMDEGLKVIGEHLPPVTEDLQEFSDLSTTLSTELPVIATGFGSISKALLIVEPLVKPIVDELAKIPPLATGIDTTATAIVDLTQELSDSFEELEKGLKVFEKLADAGDAAAKGFDNANKKADAFKSGLAKVHKAAGQVITQMGKLKKAAEEAFKAAQKVSNAKSSKSTSEKPLGSREGGYSDSPRLISEIPSAMKSLTASSPQLAEGTANTSQFSSKLPGGGIPSILHPNEAVVPLSRGRKIPVALDIDVAPIPLNNLSEVSLTPGSMDATNKSLNRVAYNIEEVTRALGSIELSPQITSVATASEINIEAPNIAPALSAQQEPSLLFEPAANGVDNEDGHKITQESIAPINITFNIQTDDLDGFKRSQDQITREISNSMRRATRRVR